MKTMTKIPTALLASAALSAILSPSCALAGTERVAMFGNREFILSDPSPETSGPKPLVVMLHGGGGGPGHAMATAGWEEISKRRGWRVAYPAGVQRLSKTGNDNGRTWNAGNCCGLASRLGMDDSSFLSDVISQTDRTLGVSKSKSGKPEVLVTGMSNGAMMAHRFACEKPSMLLAAAPVSGSFESNCKPKAPVHVMIMHGELDRNVPIKGGIPERGALRDVADLLGTTPDPRAPLSLSWDRWTSAAGCLQPLPASPSHLAKGCGAIVRMEIIPGHGHVWPHGKTRRDEPFNKNRDAPFEIADFFQRAMDMENGTER